MGETGLSEAALRLELAGRNRDLAVILNETPPFLEALRALADKIRPAREEEGGFGKSERKTIFLVDDDMVNLALGNDVLSGSYNVFTMNSGARLLKTLEKHTPDLILLDVEMPDLDGYGAIRRLKANEKTKDIPVVFLTAKNAVDDELQGLALGAQDYIHKPFSPSLLLKRIELLLLVKSQQRMLVEINSNLQRMVEAKTRTVVELQNAVMDTLAELIECRDDITGGHISRTHEFLGVLLEATRDNPLYAEEVRKWNTILILQSAQLHDVGKIAIKDSILMKPGKLTAEEFEIIKTHVSFGEEVIEKIMSKTSEQDFLRQAKIMISTHHEKWDGNGYPNGLKGEEIPLQGRMMAIVDVYDALISDRPYKTAFTHDAAVRIITEGRGTHFDPSLVEVFLNISDQFRAIAERNGNA
jgi:putative two-component system response regulator